MQDVPIDKLVNKVKSAYKLTIMASARAIELAEGATPLVEVKHGTNSLNTALEEILAGKITYKVKEVKP